jgi:hypothetical protein
VPGEYDDYITSKKRSGYQSLHTAVEGPDGALLEFQVRTRAMHDAAEFGNAAHWLYKDLTKGAGSGGNGGGGGGGEAHETEPVDATGAGSSATASGGAAAVPPAFASAAPEYDASCEGAAVGQPVQIVQDRERGGGFSAGVVCWSRGSRIHVVEPSRGDTYAPGLARTGLVDTAEWVAMGLHTALLDRAAAAGRVGPRQSGHGYLVLEFAMCSDGRWHKVDSYGRKLGTTAELLDEEALLEALERTAEEEAAAAAAAAVADTAEAATQATPASAAATAAEAEEVVAAFEARLTAAAAAREDPTLAGDERMERGSFFDTATMAADGEPRAEGLGGVAVAGVASPDDETVDVRVRAMQSSLMAYLDDAPGEIFAFDPEESEDQDDDHDHDHAADMDTDMDAMWNEDIVAGAATGFPAEAAGVANFDAADKTIAEWNGDRNDRKGGPDPKKPRARGLWGLVQAITATATSMGTNTGTDTDATVQPLTVEQALTQARIEQQRDSARADENAAAERRKQQRRQQRRRKQQQVRRNAAWLPGQPESDSPLFSIVRPGLAPSGGDRPAPDIVDATQAGG